MLTSQNSRQSGLRRVVVALAVLAGMAAAQAFGQPPARVMEKAWPVIQKAEQQSLAEIEVQVGEIHQRFDDAKKNARPFVEDVLGWGGKGRFALAGAEQALNGAASLIDRITGSRLSQPSMQDRFVIFARERFEHHVLDPGAFKREIEAAAVAYAARLQAIEGNLLVALEADVDLPEGAWKRAGTVPEVKIREALLSQVDAAIADAIADATTDFMVTAGKETVSYVGGNLLTGVALTMGASSGLLATKGHDPSIIVVAGAGLAAGYVFDKAIDAAMDAVGHDPIGKLADKVKARLDRAFRLLIEGSVAAGGNYAECVIYGLGHPNAEVRSVCAQAAEVMERHPSLGLQARLTGLHWQRAMARREALWRQAYGQDAAPPTELFVNMRLVPAPDHIIEMARECIKLYGGDEK